MVVIMPGAGTIMDIQSADNLGVQLYFDETSYRTMFEALEDVLRAKDNRLAELRDILLGTVRAGFRELYPVRFPYSGNCRKQSIMRSRYSHRTRSPGNRKNHYACRSYLRNSTS